MDLVVFVEGRAERVRTEWRLVKGVGRLFLSPGFGYAHEVPGFGHQLVDFGPPLNGARLGAIGA